VTFELVLFLAICTVMVGCWLLGIEPLGFIGIGL
jgi:hypothetical protein